MSELSNSPTVLDATVLSNFGYIDKIDLLEELPQVCTVPNVREELKNGVDSYQYLQNAVDSLETDIPVTEPSSKEREIRTKLSEQLDPGESEAVAVAEARQGTVVTDDGIARSISRDRKVKVTGSIGILIISIEDGKVSQGTADKWLGKWVNETGFRAPSSDISDYL